MVHKLSSPNSARESDSSQESFNKIQLPFRSLLSVILCNLAPRAALNLDAEMYFSGYTKDILFENKCQ